MSTDTSEDYCALIVPKFTFGEAPFYVGFPLLTAPGATCRPAIELLLAPTAPTWQHLAVARLRYLAVDRFSATIIAAIDPNLG